MKLKGRYTSREFQRVLARESGSVELKSGLGREPIQEALVAFSNTDGGLILVGVRDDGTIVGSSNDPGVDDKIHQAAHDAHDVGRYEIVRIEVDDKTVTAIRVCRREEGFAQTSNGRVLVRDGARNTALTGFRLAELVQRQTLRRFEFSPSGVCVAQADPAYVIELCKQFGWDVTSSNLSARLLEQGLAVRDDELSIAGALFLTDPQRSLGHVKAVVEIRRYPQDGREYDRRVEISGPLHHQVAEATRFVTEEIGNDVVVTGLYRQEVPRLPERVAREAIANAVAHRSYEAQGTAVVVELHPDEMIVTSPGGLPEPVTIETLRQAQSARNPRVIAVLRRFRLAEDAGLGIDVIQDKMSEALLDPPIFDEDHGRFVRVVLPLRGPITPRERAWITDLEQRGTLQAIDRLVLIHAARGKTMTNKVVRALFNVGETEARAVLRRLCAAGLLLQQGARGGASYAIVRNLAPPAAFRMTSEELARLVVEEAGRRPVSNESVRELTGLDRDGALRLLRRLVRAGQLDRQGSRRGTHYRAV